jgi:hypothetical protein
MTRRAVSHLDAIGEAAFVSRSAADRAVKLSQPQTTDAGCTAARNIFGGEI